jgi:hypothetical protein
MTALVALVSFVGAIVGAAIPAVVLLRGQYQQARIEWSQRLDRAITALTAESPLARDIGQELLADLIRSDLGSTADRGLAKRLSRTAVTDGRVDEAQQLSDNRRNGQE